MAAQQQYQRSRNLGAALLTSGSIAFAFGTALPVPADRLPRTQQASTQPIAAASFRLASSNNQFIPTLFAGTRVSRRSRRAAAKAPRPYYGLRWDPEEPTRTPDCSIAKSPTHILQAVNSRLTVLDERGRIVLDDGAGNNFRRFSELFSAIPGTEDVDWFGPRCLYDETAGRFFLAVSGADFSGKDEGWLALAVSAGPNPLEGTWTVYGYRTDLTGGPPAVRWPDTLDAGLDGTFLVAAWNDHQFSSNTFVRSRLRTFSVVGLADGSDTGFAEINGLQDSQGQPAFNVRPCRHRGTNSAFYLASSSHLGGDTLELWRLTGTPQSPTLVPTTVTGVLNYALPPNARQPSVPVSGAPDALEIGDCRVLCAVADNDRVWTTLNTSLDGVPPDAAIHITELDGATGTVVQSQSIGARGSDYFFAALDTTTGRKPGAVVLFGSSSRKQGAGLRYSARLHSMPAGKFRTSKPIISGNGRYDPLAPRDPLDPQPPPVWGRYFSVVRDPAMPERVLVAGAYSDAKKSRDPRAWATRLKFIKP